MLSLIPLALSFLVTELLRKDKECAHNIKSYFNVLCWLDTMDHTFWANSPDLWAL